ncbi:hypothetical protein FD723_15515 [Nostoc sp. C052]|uniref:hypothetical protein n=1 Tax=Nostoc sp. C052 TaxID=2576902 RepID=UPI0015C3141B|nr:hypothetical protein [Nostoc sp. C052]QLE41685.1 hypothetical protein FD723_15515 [Nostoc sp. C052]
MPRKKQRFGKLHQTLKETNYSATSGAAGEYLNYLKGTNKLTVDRKPDAKFLKIFNVGVTPFGEEPNTGSGAITAIQASITVQGDNIKSLFSAATDAAFGIERDFTKMLIDASFYAAECVITVVPTASLTQAKTQKQSKITKRNYKSYAGVRSGSVPYGRTTTVPDAQTEGGTATTPTLATVSEEDVRKSLMDVLKKGTVGGQYTVLGLHFIPEEFVEVRSFDRAKPTGSNLATGVPAS